MTTEEWVKVIGASIAICAALITVSGFFIRSLIRDTLGERVLKLELRAAADDEKHVERLTGMERRIQDRMTIQLLKAGYRIDGDDPKKLNGKGTEE